MSVFFLIGWFFVVSILFSLLFFLCAISKENVNRNAMKKEQISEAQALLEERTDKRKYFQTAIDRQK